MSGGESPRFSILEFNMSPRSTVLPDNTKPCPRCSRTLSLGDFYTTGKKVDGSPKYNSWCKECTKIKLASYHKRVWGPEALQFTAMRRTKTVRSYLQYLLGKARQRRHTELTIDMLEEIWNRQDGKCALSGIPMTRVLGKGVVNTNASIDRVKSNLGYVDGNIQLVCRIVNVMKSDLDTEEFFRLCRIIAGNKDVEDTNMAA